MKREEWMSDDGFRSGQRAELLSAAAAEPYVLSFIRQHPVLTHHLIFALACLVVATLRDGPSGYGG
jgi:hypothetical protein